MASPLTQSYGGKEHGSSDTRVVTDVHGPVPYVSLTGIKADMKVVALKLGGSAAPVAFGPADAELGTPELTVPYSYLAVFEAAMRTKAGVANPNAPLAPLLLPLTFSVISEPFDDTGPLQTRVITFTAFYLGFTPPDFDRKSNDPSVAKVMLQQTSLARVK